MNTPASRLTNSRPDIADIPHTSARLGRFVIDDSELWRVVGAMSESEVMRAALLLANLSEANEAFLLDCYLELRFGSRLALAELSKAKVNALPPTANLARATTEFQRRLAEMIERLSNATDEEICALQTELFTAGRRVLLRPEFEFVTTKTSPKSSARSPLARTGIQIRRYQHLFADDEALLGFVGVLFAGRQLLGEQRLCRCRHCSQFFFLSKNTGGRPRSRFCSDACAKSGKGLDDAERSRRYREGKRVKSSGTRLSRRPRRAK